MKYFIILILTTNLYAQKIIAVKGSKAKIALNHLKLKKGKKYTFSTTSGEDISFLVYKIKNKKAYVNIIEGKAIRGTSIKDTGSRKFKTTYLEKFKHEVSLNPLGAVFRAINLNYNYFISTNYSVGPEISFIVGSYENTQTIPINIAGQLDGTITVDELSDLSGFALGVRGNYYLKKNTRGFFIPHGLSYVSGKAAPFASLSIEIPAQPSANMDFPNMRIPDLSLTGASAYAGFGYAYSLNSFIFKAAGGARFNMLTKEVDIKVGDIPGVEALSQDPLIKELVLNYDTSAASGIFPYAEVSVGYRF